MVIFMIGIFKIDSADIINEIQSETLELCLIPSNRIKYKLSEIDIIKQLINQNVEVHEYVDPKEIIREYFQSLPPIIQQLITFNKFPIQNKLDLIRYCKAYLAQTLSNPLFTSTGAFLTYDFFQNIPTLGKAYTTTTETSKGIQFNNSAILYTFANDYELSLQNDFSMSEQFYFDKSNKNIFVITLYKNRTNYIRTFFSSDRQKMVIQQLNGQSVVGTQTIIENSLYQIDLDNNSSRKIITVYIKNLQSQVSETLQLTYTTDTWTFNQVSIGGFFSGTTGQAQITGGMTLKKFGISKNTRLIPNDYLNNANTLMYIDYDLQKQL